MNQDKLIEDALGGGAGEGPTPLAPKPIKYVWNPLTNYPRNAPCPCGSQIKFKKCHYGKISRAVPEEETKEIREMVRLTKEAKEIVTAYEKLRTWLNKYEQEATIDGYDVLWSVCSKLLDCTDEYGGMINIDFVEDEGQLANEVLEECAEELEE